MTDTVPDTRTSSDATPSIAAERETPPQRKSGSAIANLALLVSIAAIAIPFYPDIRKTAETYAGPLPWLPEQIGSVDTRAASQSSGGALPTVAMPPEFAEMQASLDKLAQDADQLSAVKSEASAMRTLSEEAAKQIGEAAKQIGALQSQLALIETAVAASNTDFKAAVSGLQSEIAAVKSGVASLKEAYANLSAPNDAPLLAAELTLLAVNGALTPEGIDPLARLVGTDPVLAEAAARVRALSGEDVLTVVALQTQFDAIKATALNRARRLQLTWLEAGISSARAMLADFGITRPHSEEKDELVIAEATRQMNNGRLERVLFELQAASPELREQLAPWMSAAQLRINLDTSIQQLIDGLMQIQAKTTAVPDAG